MAIQIKTDLCIGCGECIKHCPIPDEPITLTKKSFLSKKQVAILNNESECIECENCILHCPVQAIFL
ncbi:4Fe-4S binding protein [Floccifex sp.]|uniref:4Fe-4S binding protein n=1 Tax=Floccifex sp. TaxID=2815810 RepID=UPI002A760210|nr:4Fe-4S binding protein [Floccifex sp.]MDD7281237.1 4Fe-4S binding protein [Erysipelotrichaceae bacterium]MDY2958722.1 4Fe-4S binding protein [Floccifex sp.]